MKLGVALPIADIGGDPHVMRDFAQTAEALGYDHLCGTDHVLGVNVATRPGWGNLNTSKDFFHDPFVLFGFLSACTQKIGFSTQVLILAQRQAVLVAKQAACLDVLCNSRFRLGVGVGWNEVEFVGLNENFHNRGRRSEEQVQVMQALWANPHVTFKGKWHTIDDAGINPLPLHKKIPLWFGGHHEQTLRRIAKYGDGWMMLAHQHGQAAEAEFAKLRGYTKEAGRNPDDIGIEVWVTAGDPSSWRSECEAWKKAGATHITLHGTYSRGYHKRMQSRALKDHFDAMKNFHATVADLF